MKKLNFMAGSIGTVLTREQMKKVVGGEEACPEPTANNCSDKCPCTASGDWCSNGLCKARPF